MRALGYDIIDPAITDFAERHQLALMKEYKDCDVRSFDVPHPRKNFQLWIEHPMEDGRVVIQTCDHARPWESRAKRQVTVNTSEVGPALEEMLGWIRSHA